MSNPTASEMGRLRWANVSPADRAKHAKKMAKASAKVRKSNAAKKAID